MYTTVPRVQRYMQMEIGPAFVLVTKKDRPVCSVRSVMLHSVPGCTTHCAQTIKSTAKFGILVIIGSKLAFEIKQVYVSVLVLLDLHNSR